VILDQTATTVSGSRLRIGFAMRPPRRIGFAFAGFPVERSTSADDASGGLIDAETDILAIPYVRQSEIGIGVHTGVVGSAESY
jgi:hypothetical protein